LTFAVLARALLAIFDICLRSTTVTTVPVAAGIVIIVVAEAITLELWSATYAFDIVGTRVALRNECTVQAFALFAVAVIFGTATVTAIPSTPSVVVVVVAVTVAFPVWCTTTFFDRFDAFVSL